MAVVAMKQLLEAGVHFGHQTRRWDPRMAEYIFQARNGIHIIDLQKTSKKLDEAYEFMKEQAEEGKTVLFVGTKKQAQECMKEAAEKSGMFYVNQRWLGGTLTNFSTIIKNMTDIPGVMFVVDPKKEHNAVVEAHKLGIPVVGLVDTNCNPDDVDYVIPGNDDAIRAVKLIADSMANAIIEGKQGEILEDETMEDMAAEESVESMEEVVAAEEESNVEE